MARAAAEGHRVVLVVATDGELGPRVERARRRRRASPGGGWPSCAAAQRPSGWRGSSTWGDADSGLGPGARPRPNRTHPFRARRRRGGGDPPRRDPPEEDADVLLSYEPNGGYGHPDHKQVHVVGRRAAALAGTPRLLEATVPRDTICRAIDLAAKVYRFPPEFDRSSFDRAFSARSEITHRIGVRRHAGAKRAAMRAHASQASADGGADRTLAAFLRIPRPLYDLVFGREWFVDPSADPHEPVRHDVFAGLP